MLTDETGDGIMYGRTDGIAARLPALNTDALQRRTPMSTGQHTTSRARLLKIGEEFGRWTVIGGPSRVVSANGNTREVYPCRCQCGTHRSIPFWNLLRNHSTSCGCHRAEILRSVARTHGQSRTPLYAVWNGIIARCENPNSDCYEDYGGRGIGMCPEWRASFVAFRDWALANGYKKGLTVERKDNNKGYWPDNCEFATRAIQSQNRRCNRMLTAFGETKTVAEWSRDSRSSVTAGAIRWRVLKGMGHEDAITIPPDSTRKLPESRSSS